MDCDAMQTCVCIAEIQLTNTKECNVPCATPLTVASSLTIGLPICSRLKLNPSTDGIAVDSTTITNKLDRQHQVFADFVLWKMRNAGSSSTECTGIAVAEDEVQSTIAIDISYGGHVAIISAVYTSDVTNFCEASISVISEKHIALMTTHRSEGSIELCLVAIFNAA